MLRIQYKLKKIPNWLQLDFRLQPTIIYCLISLTLHANTVQCVEAPCPDSYWWDSGQDLCTQCSECADQMITLRPCQPHKDTLCGTLNDLEVDWSWLTQTEQQQNQNWKERRKEEHAIRESEDVLHEWQAGILGLAVVICIVFVIAAAYVSMQQVKQIKKLEKRLNKDYQELYATLSEVQRLENGTIIIEDVYKNHHPHNGGGSIEVQCIYLEELLAGKNSAKFDGPGNIYIEDSKPKSNKI